MRRALRIALALLALLAAVIAALPAVLYAYGLSLIPDERFAIETRPVPDLAIEIFWANLGGVGDPVIEPLSPYYFVFRSSDLAARLGERNGSDQLASLASHAILPRGTQIGGGMGRWHLARVSAYIWASRHWSARETIAAVLRQAYFGHDFVGLDAAASGYFGALASELTAEQLASLVVVAASPRGRDPWCYPQENRAAVQQLSEGFPALDARWTLQTTPVPPDACSA